jgi:hypothetical protein
MAFGKRRKQPGDEPRRTPPRSELERRILEVIMSFPDRIDEMETRNEENAALLAAAIARLVEVEMRRRAAGG